ncbi:MULTISPECIES: hypothetical protein [unclassified Streptomyces]|uniref:hypothetical protein n=1 Tax=unclassified Streptomyces TaxID=2593676 RepID=UPI0036E3AC52
MFNEFKARRAARRLVEAFPEITEATARDRARRLLGQYPALMAADVADSLIRGERTARCVERLRETWA